MRIYLVYKENIKRHLLKLMYALVLFSYKASTNVATQKFVEVLITKSKRKNRVKTEGERERSFTEGKVVQLKEVV